MLVQAMCKKLTASGIVTKGPALLLGMQLGMDETNDPTITIYDGLDNTGKEIVPTNKYDASALGINGYVSAYSKRCNAGIFCDISLASGNVEVVVDYVGAI